MGGAREGRFEGIEESMDRLGQLLMDPVHLVSSLARLSGLLPSRGTESLIELLLGQPLAKQTELKTWIARLTELLSRAG